MKGLRLEDINSVFLRSVTKGKYKSYVITLPRRFIISLGWREGDMIYVVKKGKALILMNFFDIRENIENELKKLLSER